MATWETKVNDAILPRTQIVSFRAYGAQAATAANYGVFFIANDPAADGRPVWEVIRVLERHQVAGSDAGAVTAMVKKVPSGTAPAAGTDVLSAGINLKATADTNQTGALTATLADRRLSSGESLAIVPTGTLTALSGLFIQVELRRVE